MPRASYTPGVSLTLCPQQQSRPGGPDGGAPAPSRFSAAPRPPHPSLLSGPETDLHGRFVPHRRARPRRPPAAARCRTPTAAAARPALPANPRRDQHRSCPRSAPGLPHPLSRDLPGAVVLLPGSPALSSGRRDYSSRGARRQAASGRGRAGSAAGAELRDPGSRPQRAVGPKSGGPVVGRGRGALCPC